MEDTMWSLLLCCSSKKKKIRSVLLLYFGPRHEACGIPRLGIDPAPPALGAQSLIESVGFRPLLLGAG